MLYPLKFIPRFVPKIWGGTQLMSWYDNVPTDCLNIGEVWVISSHENYPTQVANGRLAGNQLQELLEVYMGELVGDSVFEVYGESFPLLVKFIDAADNLSVQVHPNDEQAFRLEQAMGKNEMWYCLSACSDDASILYGWNKNVTSEEVRTMLEESNILQFASTRPVIEGDVVFIPAGRLHALNKGTVVAEIQENSDITYRLYDYDRKDDSGKKRTLHVEKALQVLDFNALKGGITHPQCRINEVTNLVETPYFITNMIVLERTLQRDYAALDSFVIYMCVSGQVIVNALDADEEQVATLRQGEAILIPACLNDIQISPLSHGAQLLETYIDFNAV